ncbi:MAG: SH3 domain-containing protein [Anaerolineae bacterium]
MGERRVSEPSVRFGGARHGRPARTVRRGPRVDLTRIPPGWAAGTLLVVAALALAVWILSMPPGETEALPPPTVPGPTPSPSPAPPRVEVGGWVQVQGTEGEDLRLRAAPGLGGETIALVQEGTLLRVLEGPVEADGYTWWRVQSPEDQTGWAAGQWLAPR